jgi:hypothetical protein
VVPSQFEPLRSPAVLGPIVPGSRGTFDAQGVTFNYPNTGHNMTRVVAVHPPHGRPLWSAVPTSAATPFIVDGALPTVGYTVLGEPTGGRPPLRVDGFLLFGPQARYVIQCQSDLGSGFGRACAQILGTFRQVGTGVGARSPLAAAVALFDDARRQRFDLAHRVATDDAVRQLIRMDPSLQPPSTCFSSDGASGPLREAADPGLFSDQFETLRIGGRWFVIRVFHCTLYGNERNCWSLSP